MKLLNRDNYILSLSQLIAILAIVGAANWLLWTWLRIPPGSGSSALAALSVWGFGVVALPASLLIGIVGIQIARGSRQVE